MDMRKKEIEMNIYDTANQLAQEIKQSEGQSFQIKMNGELIRIDMTKIK